MSKDAIMKHALGVMNNWLSLRLYAERRSNGHGTGYISYKCLREVMQQIEDGAFHDELAPVVYAGRTGRKKPRVGKCFKCKQEIYGKYRVTKKGRYHDDFCPPDQC